MARKTTKGELLALEQRYWQAIKDKNGDAAVRLSDDPCFITGAEGVRRVTRQALKVLMTATPYTLHDFAIDDPQVRLLGDDVAVVAYTVHEELTVAGRPVTLDAADTSTWVRRHGSWFCAVHTESLKGDSFGRDRGSHQPHVR